MLPSTHCRFKVETLRHVTGCLFRLISLQAYRKRHMDMLTKSNKQNFQRGVFICIHLKANTGEDCVGKIQPLALLSFTALHMRRSILVDPAKKIINKKPRVFFDSVKCAFPPAFLLIMLGI